MRISIRSGGLFPGADGPVIFQVAGNLYSDAKCDVLIGRVNDKSDLGGVMVRRLPDNPIRSPKRP